MSCDYSQKPSNLLELFEKTLTLEDPFKGYDESEEENIHQLEIQKNLCFKRRAILEKQQNYFKKCIKNIQKEFSDSLAFEPNAPFPKNFDQPPKDYISNEMKTLLQLKIELPLAISSNTIEKNYINQVWDEILNSRQFNITMNSKFSFQNCVENDDRINFHNKKSFLKKKEPPEISPIIKNKRKLTENIFDEPRKIEKKKKIEDIPLVPPSIKKGNQYIFFSFIYQL